MWWMLIACVSTSECLWQCQCRVASCTSSLRKGWAAGAQYGRWPGPSLEETWGILVTRVRKHKHSQCIVVTVKRECLFRSAAESWGADLPYCCKSSSLIKAPIFYKLTGHKKYLDICSISKCQMVQSSLCMDRKKKRKIKERGKSKKMSTSSSVLTCTE